MADTATAAKSDIATDAPPEPGAGATKPAARPVAPAAPAKPMPKEVGGPEGPEPTRYGDWQFKGRVTDF